MSVVLVPDFCLLALTFRPVVPGGAGGATPWARATKNVKKAVSHVEKLDLRFLLNKPETFLVSVTHLILMFTIVHNKF